MGDSLVIVQSEQSQLGARGPVICMKNASNPQTFRYVDEHGRIVDIDYLLGSHLGNIQRKSKNVRIGLTNVNET
jgi:hypothetical protein